MGALDALIFGYRYLYTDQTEMTQRDRISFDSDFELADVESDDWTTVAVQASRLKGRGVTGLQTNTADLISWSPDATTPVRRLRLAGALNTTDAAPHALDPYAGDPPLELEDDAIIIVECRVTATKDNDDFGAWILRRLIRLYTGVGTDGAATSVSWSDLQGSALATPWLTPVIAWNSATRMPKLTIDSNEAVSIDWQATFDIHVGG